jgi:hypothetical protein
MNHTSRAALTLAVLVAGLAVVGCKPPADPSTPAPVTTRPKHPATATPRRTPTRPARPAERWVVYTLNTDEDGRHSVTCTPRGNTEPHFDTAKTREVRITQAQYDRFNKVPVTSSIPCPG